jgi:hypothetical protein
MVRKDQLQSDQETILLKAIAKLSAVAAFKENPQKPCSPMSNFAMHKKNNGLTWIYDVVVRTEDDRCFCCQRSGSEVRAACINTTTKESVNVFRHAGSSVFVPTALQTAGKQK